MDIAIKKKTIKPIHFWLWPLLLLLAVLAIRQLLFLSKADFSISNKSIVVAEVNRGQFTVSVRGAGVLVPDNIQWLSANVEATVERVAVKAGRIVKAGELIAVLSNPQLVQELEESQWELAAQEAETNAARTAQESNLLEQKSAVLDAKLNFESSQLKLAAQSQLYKQGSGAVSKLDYDQTMLETSQFEQRWIIAAEQFGKMKENLVAQNNARKARLNKIRKSVERIQQQVDSLNVTASIDSVVQEMPLEPGQRIMMGSKIAKLAEQDSLIAELKIPEIQIRNVAIGQRVVIDTRNNKIDGVVSRIDPAVINGNVQVDVVFNVQLPDDARADLSVDGEIKIAEVNDTLYVSRPLFSQSQSRTGIYRLNKDGDFAERIMVSLGHGSANEIEVIKGLIAGDKIIISDPTSWETYDKIRID